MMYKAKVFICFEIHTKHSMQSESHVEFFNFNLVECKETARLLKVNMTFTGPDWCGIIKCSRLSHGTYTELVQKCPYFVAVVGPVCSNDLNSCASSSISTDGTSHAAEVESDDPEKKGYPAPPGWGLGHEINYLTSVQSLMVEKPNNGCQLQNSDAYQGKVIRTMCRRIYERWRLRDATEGSIKVRKGTHKLGDQGFQRALEPRSKQ